MWKKIKAFFRNPIVQFFGPGGIAAVIAWLATHAAQLPLWLIWLVVIFSVGCTFWLVNQIGVWRENHQKKFSQLPDEEIEDAICKWMTIPSCPIEKQEIEEKTFYFQVVFKNSAGRSITISRYRAQPNQIELLTKDIFPEIPRSFFDQLEIPEKEDILDRLAVEVARFGIGHKDIELPFDKPVLVETILLDDLGARYFRERLTFVLRAITLCKATIAQALRNKIFKEFQIVVLPHSDKANKVDRTQEQDNNKEE